MAATPMMQQYLDAKNACGDALLLFRMGDFYELFYDDAKAAARILGLTLTSRDKGENPIPMAGFPYHQLGSYLAKLIAAGLRAAVCEQVEDPKLAKGLVKREVTRVVSPGTLTDDALLDPRESNYLAAVALPAHKNNGETVAGIAWAELSTGRFFAASVPLARLSDELARIGPAECLLAEDEQLPDTLPARTMLSRRPAWAFGLETAVSTLQKHFQTATLDGFGFAENDSPALRAAGAVLDYLRETQKVSLAHIDRLDSAAELLGDNALRELLREQLRGVYDLERLLARVTTGRASPRDLSFVCRTLAALPKLKAKLTARKSKLLCGLESSLDLCPDVRAALESALVEDCPLATKDGGIIRGGFSGDLDRLRDLAAGGKEWIAKYQAEQARLTGITNLKVAYNKVFGYYIEITNSQNDKTPASYIRKQTTV